MFWQTFWLDGTKPKGVKITKNCPKTDQASPPIVMGPRVARLRQALLERVDVAVVLVAICE